MSPRSRLHDEDVIVIGLGRFGTAAALELQRLGHRVYALESDAATAERFVGRVSKVVHADATHPAVFDDIRTHDFKLAVVGIGSSLEGSVLASSNLLDIGVPGVWAKAITDEHAKILHRIGVHHVVRPEADSGYRVAHLVNGRLLDYIEFDDDFAIVKMHPPKESIGFTLAQSALRSKYGVTVVGVKSPGRGFTHAVPETKVAAHDTLIVSGPNENLERLAGRP
ncbi:potassium channel family protein [Kribbia dieselivorans]|uniref:potassium channel family protein n=1 Tax=Kribbia dieselivorans TaxID=331526 RepID=UPI00083819ED|nr:TrkA family potassium uptake protein [Kribbia dieselivorans]